MDTSYGVIPIYKSSKEVLLVESLRGEWGFPKGHPEKDEDGVVTALRELMEETGIVGCELDPDSFYTSTYTYTRGGERFKKQVHFYVGCVKNKETKPQEGEISATKWCSYREALQTLSFEDARLALKSFEYLLV